MRKGNLQVFGNIGSGHYWMNRDERENDKNTREERENFSQSSSAVKISSEEQTPGQFLM